MICSHDLMRATFPVGTVSGAPKIRAMQIISELAPWDNAPSGEIVRVMVYPTGREATTRGANAGCVKLFQLQRQSGRLHHHPHGAAQGRQSLRSSRWRLGERRRTRSGISGNGEQEQSHRPSAVSCYGGRVLKAVALAETLAKPNP